MSARQFRTAAIPTLILLAGGALVVSQLSVGRRVRAEDSGVLPRDPDTMTRVIATHPPVELVEQRDDHTRVWEIVKEVETTDPDGSTSVDTVKSHIHEKGSGLCYKDASGSYVPAVAEWRETPDGFVIDRCHYRLTAGQSLGTPMCYTVAGRRLLLRPSYLMAWDGMNEALLATVDLAVTGQVGLENPSVLSFPAAFGPGLDIEIVAEKSGFHQNLIISEDLGLPGGFDAARTRLYVYTSIDASDYISDPTCWARFGAEPIDLGAGGLLAPASEIDTIILGGFREGAVGTFCDGPILSFEVSPVYDSAAPRIPDLFAERQLMRDEASGELFLIESVPLGFLGDASLPVVLDYVTVSGSLEGQHIWQTGTTYFVSSNLYVSGTGRLIIQPGVFVKLNCNTSIIVQDSLQDEWGKVVAVGTDTNHIRFTSADDDNWGDYISRPPAVAGSYNTALYLAGGSSTQSQIQYCMFRKGGIAVWDFQEITEPISHNRISQMEYQGIGIWFYGLSGGGGLHNNLITGCSMVGVALTYATVPGITNNTIDDCERGINAWNSSCYRITNNLLTNCTFGIRRDGGTGTLVLGHNGYWKCTTPVYGTGAGFDNVLLTDPEDPYVPGQAFLLDQSSSSALIDAGSCSAKYAGLEAHSTAVSGQRDVKNVDIGYHYPQGYFNDAEPDGMPDAWEIAKLGGTGEGPDDDHDGDDVTNLVEYQEGTNPDSSNTDSDTLTDWQEYIRGGGGAEANLEGGPYLLDRAYENTTGMRVRWYSSTAYRGSVRYRRDTQDGWSVNQDKSTSTRFHNVIVPISSPGETYFYEVGRWQNEAHTKLYGIRHFRAPSPGVEDFKFVVYGDNRGDPDTGEIPSGLGYQEYHARVARGILEAAQDAAFILHVGDFVNGGQNEGEWCPQLLQPAACLYETTPIFTCMGNHEEANEPGAQDEWTGTYYDEFFHNKRWYSLDYGDCHFVCLDTNKKEWFDVGPPDPQADAQRIWLSGDLQKWSGKAVFLWFHQPPFSSGNHRGEHPGVDVKDILVPIFQEQGANMAFSGHDHLYERALNDETNAVRYIVTGGGGAPLHNIVLSHTYPPGVREAWYAKNSPTPNEDAFHYCVIDVASEAYEFKMYKWSEDSPRDQWP